MAKVDYANSLSTAGQFPLNGKLRFKTLSDMKVLGNNAFRYEEDMSVWCLETHKEYIWRERLNSDAPNHGVLSNDYIYPTGAIADGISYAGRSFNFFEISYGVKNSSCINFHDGTLEMCNVDTILNNQDISSNITLRIKIPQVLNSNITGTIEIKSKEYNVSNNIINFNYFIENNDSEGDLIYSIPSTVQEGNEESTARYTMSGGVISANTDFAFYLSFPSNQSISSSNKLVVTLSSLKITFENPALYDASLWNKNFNYLSFFQFNNPQSS